MTYLLIYLFIYLLTYLLAYLSCSIRFRTMTVQSHPDAPYPPVDIAVSQLPSLAARTHLESLSSFHRRPRHRRSPRSSEVVQFFLPATTAQPCRKSYRERIVAFRQQHSLSETSVIKPTRNRSAISCHC